MSNRHQTIQVECTGDEDESERLLNAYIAGIKAAGLYFQSKSRVADGPEAVDAPALDASIGGGQVKITNPNFNPEDGIEYYLQTSEDGEVWDTIADNQGPNDENFYTYTATTRFRIVAGSTAGPMTAPIP
jgi:hypothetical protein